jgi:succinate dehydrogenase/fumarate reductase flavoprotein subunit
VRARKPAAVLMGARAPPPHSYDTIKGADWLGDQDAIQVRVAPA